MLECCGLQPCSGDRVPCLVQIKSKKDSKKTQDSDCSIQIKFLFIQLLPKLSLSPTKQKTKTKQTKNPKPHMCRRSIPVFRYIKVLQLASNNAF